MSADDADPERAAPNIWNTTPKGPKPGAAPSATRNQVWPVRVNPARRRGAGAASSTARPFALGPTFEVGGVRLGLSDYMTAAARPGC